MAKTRIYNYQRLVLRIHTLIGSRTIPGTSKSWLGWWYLKELYYYEGGVYAFDQVAGL